MMLVIFRGIFSLSSGVIMRHTLLLALVALLCSGLIACAESPTEPVGSLDTVWTRNHNLLSQNYILFSHDGNLIISATNSDLQNQINIIQTATGDKIQTLPVSTAIEAIALSPDNQILAVAGANAKIYVYNLHTYSLLQTLQGHVSTAPSATIADLDFSPDGQYLVSSGYDQVIVWNIATYEPLVHFGNEKHFRKAVFLGSSTQLLYNEATYGQGDSLFIVHLPEGKIVRSMSLEYTIYDPQYIASSNLIAARARFPKATRDYIILIDPVSGEVRKQLYNYEKTLNAFTATPSGHYLLTAATDGYTRIWETTTGKESHVITFNGEWGYIPFSCIAVSPDSAHIVTATSLFVLWNSPWNTTTGIQSKDMQNKPVALLSAPYPVPGTDDITLKYNLDVTAEIRLEICDNRGNNLAVLTEQQHTPGEYKLLFQPAQYNLAAGTYFCRFFVDNTLVSTSILPIQE
jgi:WD40 repeat protein